MSSVEANTARRRRVGVVPSVVIGAGLGLSAIWAMFLAWVFFQAALWIIP